MSRILVIDDEAAIRDVLVMSLQSEKFEVKAAKDAKSGKQLAQDFHPHLIILDLGLPDQSGYEVLKDFRAWTTIPILILTVNDDEKSKVALLDAGADDYLTKPFSTPELMARIRVALRHNRGHRGQQEATPEFVSGDLRVDLNLKKVEVDGQLIKLTKTEFEVIAKLVRENGKVVSQSQLMKQIWGAQAVEETHYLRIYINQLRKKIEKNPAEPQHILTEPGVGYRIV